MKTIKLSLLLVFIGIISFYSLISRPEWEVISFDGWFTNPQSDNVNKMIFDKNNNAWICAQITGLLKYNVFYKNYSYPNPTDIYCYKDSILWVSNSNNNRYLQKINYKSNSLIYNLKDTSQFYHQGLCVSVEKDSVAWVGTNCSLERYDGHTHLYFDSSNSPMPYNYVKKLAVDKNLNKWIVTVDVWNGNRYNVLKYNDTTWTVYNDTNSALRGISVSSISVDSSNNIWLGTTDGLGKFDTVWHYYKYPEIPLDSISNYVSAIETDKQGIVWVGTPGAVLKYQNSTWIKYSNYDAIGLGPSAIAKDTNGNIWLACNEQFVVFKSGGVSGRIIVRKDTGQALFDDSLLATSVSPYEGNSNTFRVVIPNPFARDLQINYYLEKDSQVELMLYDMNGILIKEIYKGRQDSGNQNMNYNASGISSGSYYMLFKINGEINVRKLIKVE